MFSMPVGYEVPEAFVVVRLQHGDKEIYRVLAAWGGGYTGADAWRFSTEIVEAIDQGECWIVTTKSGSQYELKKHLSAYTLTALTSSIYNDFFKRAGETGVELEIVKHENLEGVIALFSE